MTRVRRMEVPEQPKTLEALVLEADSALPPGDASQPVEIPGDVWARMLRLASEAPARPVEVQDKSALAILAKSRGEQVERLDRQLGEANAENERLQLEIDRLNGLIARELDRQVDPPESFEAVPSPKPWKRFTEELHVCAVEFARPDLAQRMNDGNPKVRHAAFDEAWALFSERAQERKPKKRRERKPKSTEQRGPDWCEFCAADTAKRESDGRCVNWGDHPAYHAAPDLRGPRGDGAQFEIGGAP